MPVHRASLSMAEDNGTPQLRAPRTILDMVNYQMHLIESRSASNVTRMCEGEFGITRREWRFIAMLAAGGEVAPSELSLRSGLDRSRTSKALMELLAKGLIERRSQAGDRRRATVSLTAEGRSLYELIFPRVVEVNTALLEVLDDTDVAALARILTLLRRRAIEIVNSDLVSASADRRHGGSKRKWKSGKSARPAPPAG